MLQLPRAKAREKKCWRWRTQKQWRTFPGKQAERCGDELSDETGSFTTQRFPLFKASTRRVMAKSWLSRFTCHHVTPDKMTRQIEFKNTDRDVFRTHDLGDTYEQENNRMRLSDHDIVFYYALQYFGWGRRLQALTEGKAKSQGEGEWCVLDESNTTLL